ncbi:MAG TPA: cyclase family protein, partial [Smithellaceae bacterium]|nr:cyclase family protein [Smithellaceae bacterium]
MIIDLTKPLDSTFIPFSSGEYTDPPLEISEWGAISNEGFRVSRLSMGTQTGTHIDAPAHFVEGGAMLETLSPDQLFGSFFLVDLPDRSSSTDVANRFAAYRQEQIIFLRTSGNSTPYLSIEI